MEILTENSHLIWIIGTFWVMHYIEVQNFVFKRWTSWVSKDAEFYLDFKNINLPL
jgi:hypothetical protein